MGSATARLFAAEGAAVCVADLKLERAEAVAEEIRTSDGRAHSIRLDVRNSETGGSPSPKRSASSAA